MEIFGNPLKTHVTRNRVTRICVTRGPHVPQNLISGTRSVTNYTLPQMELANVLGIGPNSPLSNLSLNLYMLFLHHLDDDRCPKAI